MKSSDNQPLHPVEEILAPEEMLWPAELQAALEMYPRLEVGRDFNARVMQRLHARARPTLLDRVAAIFARPLPKLLGSFGMGAMLLLPTLWVMKPSSNVTATSTSSLPTTTADLALMAQSPTNSPLRSSAALRYGALMREDEGDFGAQPLKKPSTRTLHHHIAPILDDPRRRSLCPYSRAPLA